MNRLRYILQHRYFIKIFCLIIVFIFLIYTNTYKKKSLYQDTENIIIGKIYKKKVKNNKITLYLKAKEKIIVELYEENNLNYHLGDNILVEGTMKIPSKNTIPNSFNYYKYLYNKDIFYLFNASKITIISNNTSIIYYIKEKINNYIENIEYQKEYLKTFILGDSSEIDEEVLTSYRNNGISHLFSVSGMHISLFASIILYFLKRISYNNYYNYSIVIIFLISYGILISFSPSVIRSITMYILFTINKLFNLKIKNIDIMCLTLIIILFINPYYLYEISFEYSYIISFSLVLFSKKIKNKNKLISLLYTSFISFLVSFPICIYNYHQVNILSIFYNIILIPYISFLVFPLSLICFIIPKLSIILNILINILESISLFLNKYNLGVISFYKPHIIIIFLYYILISLFLYNKKYIYIFILIFLNKVYPYINPSLKITCLSVGQGDSILINFPHNKNNILIDTGGNMSSESSLVINKTIPYLKSIDIKKIEYLIISHADFDHMGWSIDLVENFKVENVIFNCGEFNDLEQELIKVLDKKKIKYYSCIKELNIDKYKLQFLNTKEYDNENDNSNVIYFNYNNYKFLFMGDAGIEKEKDILDKYNLRNIDFLKVGHHGSNTSSSEYFINSINPKYSLISVGKNNRYGHPKDEVLDTLKNSKIYRTDLDGSIEIRLNKNGYKIRTCPP